MFIGSSAVQMHWKFDFTLDGLDLLGSSYSTIFILYVAHTIMMSIITVPLFMLGVTNESAHQFFLRGKTSGEKEEKQAGKKKNKLRTHGIVHGMWNNMSSKTLFKVR